MLGLTAFFCVFVLVTGKQPTPSDGPEIGRLLETVRQAHGASVPYQVEYVTLGALGDDIPQAVRESLAKVPGAVVRMGPESQPLYALHDLVLVSDGAGRTRVEMRSLTAGGPAERRTSVEIWTDTTLCRSVSIGAESCEVNDYGILDYPAQISLQRQGRTPHRRMRALQDYQSFVRYAIDTLSQASDVKSLASTDGQVELSSIEAGLSMTCLNTTGEVTGGSMTGAAGTDIWVYAGWFDDRIFPARHPRERRGRHFAPGEPVPLDAMSHLGPGLVLYKAVRRIDPPKIETFDWRRVAKRAVDYRGNVTMPDGTVKPALASGSRPETRPMPEPEGPGPIPVHQSSDRLFIGLMAGGVAFVLLGICLWARRRLL